MAGKAEFLRSAPTLSNHVPSVDLGAFDLAADPAAHALRVTVKACLMPGDDAAQLQLTKFGARFREQIPAIWNGKVRFVCTKEGWEDVYLEPTFSVQITGLDSAHYRVQVDDEDVKSHLQGPNAVVTQHTVSGAGGGGGFVPRTATFGAQSTLDVEIEAYRRNVIYDLSKAPLEIAVGDDPATDEVCRQRVAKFAREIVRLKVPRKFRSSRRPTLTVLGCGPGNRQVRARSVIARLRGEGLKNPMVEAADGPADGAARVRLSFDKAELVNLFPEKPASAKSLFKQVTVAHEMGHMLGLPDEYLCMHARTGDAMRDIYALTAPQLGSFKGSGMQIADVRQVDGVEEVPHIVRHQEAFVRLCRRAGLVPPAFGRMTSSVMSNGMVFHPYHFVTVWEALCQASGFDDWAIRLR